MRSSSISYAQIHACRQTKGITMNSACDSLQQIGPVHGMPEVHWNMFCCVFFLQLQPFAVHIRSCRVDLVVRIPCSPLLLQPCVSLSIGTFQWVALETLFSKTLHWETVFGTSSCRNVLCTTFVKEHFNWTMHALYVYWQITIAHCGSLPDSRCHSRLCFQDLPVMRTCWWKMY